jgi:hypothetical protein
MPLAALAAGRLPMTSAGFSLTPTELPLDLSVRLAAGRSFPARLAAGRSFPARLAAGRF